MKPSGVGGTDKQSSVGFYNSEVRWNRA